MTEHHESNHAPRLLEPVPPAARSAQGEPAAVPMPPWHVPPRSIADTGLDTSLLLGLLLKAAYLHRSVTLAVLTESLKLPATVANEVAAVAVRERLMEVAHRGASDLDVRFRLTEAGYTRAAESTARCSYSGAAPVTLDAYLDAVQRHSVSHASVSKADVTAAFHDLVIPARLLDAIGMALNTCRALMIYGPAGSGKTYLAQRLGMLLPGAVPVPHAITVAGEIIQVFDPLVHVPIDDSEASPARRVLDRRWVVCHRPVVLSGGELTLSMLDLRYDSAAGFYQAPPHMKANNGIYIIDDLGRQLVGVDALLNRWIVPLDRNVDMFTLRTGVRFSIPFDVWPVFSSNLEPAELADDAFLRRLGSKLYVGALSRDDYRQIYQRTAADFGLTTSESDFDFLVQSLHDSGDMPLLACIPRDLLRLVASSVRYHGHAPHVTEEALLVAWQTYYGLRPDAGTPPATRHLWHEERRAAG
ncbi:ATP-binding protein [Cupriavidus consociatus]|uniref:ATP-binding protein n=1 Tax=Cupriavidus consociatus TaxID=2821357 RepID=UPI001AEB84C6|nr:MULTISPECIES: ATP-binding protein [unclassified Cupriavidus]MBP0622289.1 ATP-binding protein [Cupriavidus sp. LEh25]MDK2658966.1 ATP-binding protein [Cupriavidus sp. LEh21]